MTDTVLSWIHFGDLHMTRDSEQNYADFLAIIDTANKHLAGHVAFAVLPGDNADNGTADQFKLLRNAIDRLRLPLHILPGDHDFQPRNLDAFYAILGAARLPRSIVVAEHRCLFLDIVSAGAGGLDFRLDATQLEWIANQLAEANKANQRALVFMHAYPADLCAGSHRLRALLAHHRVTCVDMGHTHYNELANDGRTIFMATRSTGQIEEGPVGSSVAAIDAGVVSWRFVPLASTWPLVLITRPADYRLVTDPASPDQIANRAISIRAKLWSMEGIRHAFAQIDGGGPITLAPHAADPSLWHADTDLSNLPDGPHVLLVRAQDKAGCTGTDTITFLIGRDHPYTGPQRHADGSDRDAIGAWPEKGLLGSQLGPNRNGRKW